jgi:hypothetical protein
LLCKFNTPACAAGSYRDDLIKSVLWQELNYTVVMKRPGFVKGIDYFCSCVVNFFKLVVEPFVAIQSVLLLVMCWIPCGVVERVVFWKKRSVLSLSQVH